MKDILKHLEDIKYYIEAIQNQLKYAKDTDIISVGSPTQYIPPKSKQELRKELCQISEQLYYINWYLKINDKQF